MLPQKVLDQITQITGAGIVALLIYTYIFYISNVLSVAWFDTSFFGLLIFRVILLPETMAIILPDSWLSLNLKHYLEFFVAQSYAFNMSLILSLYQNYKVSLDLIIYFYYIGGHFLIKEIMKNQNTLQCPKASPVKQRCIYCPRLTTSAKLNI